MRLPQGQQLARDGNFEDAIGGRRDRVLRSPEAAFFRLDVLIVEFSFAHVQNDAQFLIASQRDAKFGVLKSGQTCVHGIHADVKAVRAKAVTKLMQPMHAAVHGAFLAVGRIESRAQPLKISGLAPIHAHIEKGGRRDDVRRRRFALDGLGQLVGSLAAQALISLAQQLTEERVEFRIVCGTVFGAEPPAPVAALGHEQGVECGGELRFARSVWLAALAPRELPGIKLARPRQ